ncbi:hypothetical protein J4405_05035 [Candidatus Woesearchaeota archaeon]|nr:hypothetical protein [Candidatus Woesearchaeota archaeon]
MEEIGTLRIGSKDLKVYTKLKNSWKLSKKEFPNAIPVVKLFKAHNNLKTLIDTKDSKFLKGFVVNNEIKGARINILPDGRKLDKAYSLFADELIIHDETSNNHWDVLYKNKGGTYSYVYTLDKIKNAVTNKYKKEEEFEKYYPKLKKNVSFALKDKKDSLALPMYTLLETNMRVGNEMYYKLHGHKGLTTLKKNDVSIKGENVTFNYLAKDGVPMNVTKQFPSDYIGRLSNVLKEKKKNDFIFVGSNGHPLLDTQFKEAFKKYCGREFYPHMVRSYYATKKTEEFLEKHKKASKEEVKDLFLSIAEELGHKRFDKKENIWKDSYNVTIHHYIKPELVEKVKNLIK